MKWCNDFIISSNCNLKEVFAVFVSCSATPVRIFGVEVSTDDVVGIFGEEEFEVIICKFMLRGAVD